MLWDLLFKFDGGLFVLYFENLSHDIMHISVTNIILMGVCINFILQLHNIYIYMYVPIFKALNCLMWTQNISWNW